MLILFRPERCLAISLVVYHAFVAPSVSVFLLLVRALYTQTRAHTQTHTHASSYCDSPFEAPLLSQQGIIRCVCLHSDTHHLHPLKATREKSASTLSLNCFIWSLTCLKMTLDKNIEATPEHPPFTLPLLYPSSSLTNSSPQQMSS